MIEADDTIALAIDPESCIPTTRYVLPCNGIPPDTKEFEGVVSIAERYAKLATPLPLAGAAALQPLRNGSLAVTACLQREAPWMSYVIDLLDEQFRLGLWAGRPWIAHRPILLVGPPGAGKSHFARLLADAAGTGFTLLSMAGVFDAASIDATPRTFIQPLPCLPALAMHQARTANPIVVVDELEKAGRSERHGNPLAALLTLIEPSTAAAFYDRCLLAHIDVSHVNWIMTANSIESLSPALRSRCDIVTVPGPGPEHFDELLRTLLRDIARRWRIPPASMPSLEPRAEELLRARFARSRSARQLGRELRAALAAGVRLTRRTIN